MGIYLNPGTKRFREALNSQIYVDKTAMVADVNALVNTVGKYLCVSRPRRFGKSMTAAMLAAYYGPNGNSRSLFENRLLAQCPDWDKYLGKFDVIRLVLTDFINHDRSMKECINLITKRVLDDLGEQYPTVHYDNNDFVFSLAKFCNHSDRQFVIIIDEWDAIFREYPNDVQAQKDYLDFLRNLLKDQDYVALAYMTGILPVKKYGKHSALNMFTEYSMIAPLMLAPYTGFTEDEVRQLCREFGRSFDDIKAWYDGYQVTDAVPADPEGLGLKPNLYHLYAPLSVVRAVSTGAIQNWWNKTETYEALAEYIRMDFDGMKETVARLMEGEHIPVSLGTYSNDMTTMTCRDDILALLIHLGYLGYDQAEGRVFIPNREILDEYKNSTQTRDWSSTFRALKNSRRLVAATEAGDAETIAELVEAAHDKAGNRTYNSEAALSYAIQLAYYAAQDDYTLFPEVDTGRGFADLLYIPKHPGKPAMLIELKYEQDARTAIDQIQRQRYPDRLEQYKGNIILVGINYDRSASPSAPDFKHHSCQVLKA